jgi:hypothetical protein
VNTSEIEHLQEKVFLNSPLVAGAGKGSAAIDHFASWLLAGFGAALALLLSNLDSLATSLPLGCLRSAAIIFIVAATFGVVEKFLAVIISGAVEASGVGASIGEKAAEREVELDLAYVFSEAKAASYPPMRWLLAGMLNKAQRGDLAAPGRFFTHCTQAQSVLALIETFLILFAAATIIRSLAA